MEGVTKAEPRSILTAERVLEHEINAKSGIIRVYPQDGEFLRMASGFGGEMSQNEKNEYKGPFQRLAKHAILPGKGAKGAYCVYEN